MGRWLASLCSEEKNTQKPLDRTDETDKTLSWEVLSVLSVPSPGISEKFSAGGSRIFGIDRAPDPGEVEVEERKGMAVGGLPAAYLDVWARLECQKPAQIAEAAWRQAIDDAGRFLDQLGSLAVQFGWTPGDLFDVSRDGKPGGLVWFQKGECVRALGLEHAVLGNGTRVFDKLTFNQEVMDSNHIALTNQIN